MLSLVSTWMGDRLGTLGAVGILLFIFFLQFSWRSCQIPASETDPEYINIRVHTYFFHFHIIR